ncbi:GntR family transcriptional regulator, partial [Clostridium tertium]
MINTDIMKKSKKLRYVEVYNTLFKMIKEEDLPDNYRLPSEPDLAKELGVSRTTLRQALSLLQDDGLIKNIRGKGNFIIRNQKNKKIGLEKLGHIIYKSLEDKIDH